MKEFIFAHRTLRQMDGSNTLDGTGTKIAKFGQTMKNKMDAYCGMEMFKEQKINETPLKNVKKKNFLGHKRQRAIQSKTAGSENQN